MLKYVDTKVTFSEIPNEISLCINFSNCPNKCVNCHSPELSEDIGIEVTFHKLEELILKNTGVTAICFMGGDATPASINLYAKLIKQHFPYLKIGWYSGKQELADETDLHNFDYLKLGPYIEELGPLTSRTTNQRFYKVVTLSGGTSKLIDKTYLFWKNADKC